jgi:hypothetical protein
MQERIPLPKAARLMHKSWAQAYRLVLRNELDAVQDEHGRWLVDVLSVDRHRPTMSDPENAP